MNTKDISNLLSSINIAILFRSWMSKYIVKIINNASVYRKPTFRGVLTNLKSFISIVYRFGLGYTLLHQYFHIASSYQEFHNKMKVLKQVFKLKARVRYFLSNF